MSIRGVSLGVALLLVGGVVRGGEVEATPVCRPYGPSTSYYPDPVYHGRVLGSSRSPIVTSRQSRPSP